MAVTSAIDYCISESLPKLYVLTGHGEADLSLEFKSAVERENIEMESLSLASVQQIPADAAAILVNAPGGMLVYGLLIALVCALTKGKVPIKRSFSCAGCSSAGNCHTGSCMKKGDEA